MTPKNMRVLNRLFERIKSAKSISITELCLVEHVSIWSMKEYKPYLLDLHPEITYGQRRFTYHEVTEVIEAAE